MKLDRKRSKNARRRLAYLSFLTGNVLKMLDEGSLT